MEIKKEGNSHFVEILRSRYFEGKVQIDDVQEKDVE